MDARERAVLLCLAMKDEAHEIVDFFDKEPSAGHPDCEHVATPW